MSINAVDGKIYLVGGVTPQDRFGTSIVEEYDPGLEAEGVEAKGKQVTSWGKMKK